MLEEILAGLVTEIVTRIGESTMQGIVRSLSGRPQEVQLASTLKESLKRLTQGYRDAEASEGPFFLVDDRFFGDVVVRNELIKLYSPEPVRWDVIERRFVALYGYDNIESFRRNLADFKSTFDRVNWERMSLQQQHQTAFLMRVLQEGKVDLPDQQGTLQSGPIGESPISSSVTPPSSPPPSESFVISPGVQDIMRSLAGAMQNWQDQTHAEHQVYRETIEAETRQQIDRAIGLLKRGEISRGYQVLKTLEQTRAKVLDRLAIDLRLDLFRLIVRAHDIANNS